MAPSPHDSAAAMTGIFPRAPPADFAPLAASPAPSAADAAAPAALDALAPPNAPLIPRPAQCVRPRPATSVDAVLATFSPIAALMTLPRPPTLSTASPLHPAARPRP